MDEIVLQIARAEPRPDFAVNGQISGTATITSLALETKDLFTSVGAKVFDLSGGYTRLSKVKTAMDTIATKISKAGETFTQALASLSTNNSNNIAANFDPVFSAITALRTLVTTGLQAEQNVISSNAETAITSKIADNFRALAAALSTISQALTALRNGVQSARNAAGNTNPIPAATMRRFVTSNLITNLTIAVRQLKSDIPSLVYVVTTTLSSLQNADQFLISITAEAQRRATEVGVLADNYGGFIDTYVSSIKTNISTGLETPYVELQADYVADLEPTFQLSTGYDALFDPMFTTMDAIYSDDTDITGVIDTAFQVHQQAATVLDNNLLQFYGNTVCKALQDLIQVLIINGKDNGFCYSKFFTKVFNMFVIHTYDAGNCYQLEITRFEDFHAGLRSIVQLILHDIEDFIELFEGCSQFTDVASCTSYLVGEYNTLLAFTLTKRDYLKQILEKEAEASLLRLTACFANSKHLLMVDAEEMVVSIAVCKEFGAVAPV
ncbi:hypothetical protein ZHAS_00014404 [Anopheles sinensis]|uniref:Uncharacterized protein n=1 Tax=Anopheles sinensis TaxID=74873 RepID=A0A084W863_ANOSI|nr:hypothetical protein ZHAS_00014404 [Anopheles sinensis]